MLPSYLLRIKRKFNLIASSRLVTCYHPTPEDVGIRAGNIITDINEAFLLFSLNGKASCLMMIFEIWEKTAYLFL